MLERQKSEQLELYKLRIKLLVNSILPSNVNLEESPHNDLLIEIKDALSPEEWDSLSEKLPESINEIYRIGCKVIENSSCLLMEDMLDYTISSLKKEFDKLEKEYELIEMSLNILRRKLELQQELVDLCVDYEDISKIDTIKPSEAKNLAEILNKSVKPLREICEGIERLEITKQTLKVAKNSLKNA